MAKESRNKRALRFAVSGALLLGAPAGLSACGDDSDRATSNELAPEQPSAAAEFVEEAAPEGSETAAGEVGEGESALPVGRPPGTRPTSNMTAPPRDPRPPTMDAVEPLPVPSVLPD